MGCLLDSLEVLSVIHLVSKGEIIANQPNISFCRLRLKHGSRLVSWVVSWLGGTRRTKIQSLGLLSLSPSGRAWRPRKAWCEPACKHFYFKRDLSFPIGLNFNGSHVY